MSAGMSAITLRDAGRGDCAAIEAIYADHVLHGLASWEQTPPQEAQIAARMDEIKNAGFPYRVAVVDGFVRGYAYAGQYRPRAAYRYTVENSLYVDSAHPRKGIGSALLEDLIDQCTTRGFRQMIAVIGDSANAASIALHKRHGFEHGGVMRALGYKHERWLDQVIMQRPLGEGAQTPP